MTTEDLHENPSAYWLTNVAQTFCCLKQIALTAIKLEGENQLDRDTLIEQSPRG